MRLATKIMRAWLKPGAITGDVQIAAKIVLPADKDADVGDAATTQSLQRFPSRSPAIIGGEKEFSDFVGITASAMGKAVFETVNGRVPAGLAIRQATISVTLPFPNF